MSQLVKKSKKGFLLPPAVGYSFHIVLGLVWKNKISLRYYFRLLITIFINIINFPFRTFERLFINPKYKKQDIKNPPIFIVGHWRSGTTHLHNLLCQDQKMGYTTTFQSVFPDTIFNNIGNFIFEGFAKLLIPGRRAGDNVVLDTKLPQEEEFALGDKTPISFYYFWMFPQKIKEYYKHFIQFKDLDSNQLESWKSDYKLLIKKSLKNTNKNMYLSKNPPNTGRVEMLLEMFPNAKFIHIHRNPVEVFLSTHNFFSKMMPHLQLQTIPRESLDVMVFELYENLMSDYLKQRELIPKGNLVEVSFDCLQESPMDVLNNIYKKLNLSGFERAEINFKTYIESKKSYKKNTHKISKNHLETLKTTCKFVFEEYNYNIPENIEIIND
ncbi:sulfotransferase family protein [Formosa maritima]|uniref:Sulfotransferase n=1 Tax=Formosa maritima TaxID=2592046 RepID=A0A5D0G530_9FLAO|nr:sulfotransferase [Formosa maritima]TYA53811.1 sulfotransferase [Formosa maritima]